MTGKISQEEAEYTDTPAGGPRRCIICSMFFDGEPNSCTAVEGHIKPLGRCKLWENLVTGQRRPDSQPRQDLGDDTGETE